MKSSLIEKLKNTTIVNQATNDLVGRIVLKEFKRTNDIELASELLTIALKLKLCVFDQMIDLCRLQDIKSMFNLNIQAMEYINDEELLENLPMPLFSQDYPQNDLETMIHILGFLNDLDTRFVEDYWYATCLVAVQMN